MVIPDPKHALENLQFLKLGGSLITDKRQPRTPRLDVIERLVREIKSALQKEPNRQLLIGHGSGSFGHVPARKYGTREGVSTPEQWRGFVEVWSEAAALNRIVVDAMSDAGLPVVTFPPSACITARDHRVVEWNLTPIREALSAGLLPVVYGDVVFDRSLGGTILSTEDLFSYLAKKLRPLRILLAGMEEGVWRDYPACTRILPEITPDSAASMQSAIGGSAGTDVTGGMYSKVLQSLAIAGENPGLEVLIFSGEEAGSLEKALMGAKMGTIIRAV